jgi:hypothetical protein
MRWLCPTLTVLVVLVALWRAATASHPPGAFRADDATARALFEAEARAEPEARATARRGFAGDLWSADDDFHAHELTLARALAVRHGVTVADVLRAIDDGLHGRWPPPAGPAPLATAPPCHPRPVY